MMIEDLFSGIQYWLGLKINSLPAEEQQIGALLQLTQRFAEEPEYAVKLTLPSHDDPRGMYFAWQGEGYFMVLAIPMEDYGWSHPLVLAAGGLAYGEVESVLEGVLLAGKSTDEIPVIMEKMKDITSTVYRCE